MKRVLKIIGGGLGILVVGYAIAILAGAEDEAWTENHVVIDRPPAVVFDYASDMRHELQWNPDCESMSKLTEGPIGLGTRFQAKWKQSEQVTVEVKTFDRPNHLTLANGGTLETTVDVTLAPQGTGTLFTSRFTARPHGFLKVIFPIFKLMMGKFEAANMQHLKHAIESAPAAAP